MRFVGPIHFARRARRLRTRPDRRLQPFFDKSPPHPGNRGPAHVRGGANLLIGPAGSRFSFIRLQQDLRSFECPGCDPPPVREGVQRLAFVGRQRHHVLRATGRVGLLEVFREFSVRIQANLHSPGYRTTP